MRLKSDGVTERWWLCFLSEKCHLSHDFRWGLCLQRKPTCTLWHCPKCSHCSCTTAQAPTDPQSCRAVAASFLLQGTALQEQRSSREKGSQKKGKMGWQSRCERTVGETKAKARKQSLALLFSLKKEQKQEKSWITFLFSPSQTEHQVENTTVLGWCKLSGQTKRERSLNSERVFTAKAWFFTLYNEPTLVVLR